MPALKITIRLATLQDAETIAKLSRETFYDTFAEYNTKDDIDLFMNEQFTEESLMDEVGISSNIFLLAYSGDELAGYAKLREGKSPIELKEFKAMEIARIYASRDKIGKGVGMNLMQRSIEIAKQKNKNLIWLAVWEKNQRAFNFYTKWGFERFGTQIFVLGTDLQKDWLMRKTL